MYDGYTRQVLKYNNNINLLGYDAYKLYDSYLSSPKNKTTPFGIVGEVSFSFGIFFDKDKTPCPIFGFTTLDKTAFGDGLFYFNAYENILEYGHINIGSFQVNS